MHCLEDAKHSLVAFSQAKNQALVALEPNIIRKAFEHTIPQPTRRISSSHVVAHTYVALEARRLYGLLAM